MAAKNINDEEYAYVIGNGRCFHRKGAGCSGEHTGDMTLATAIDAARDPDDVDPCGICLSTFVSEHVPAAGTVRNANDPPAYSEPYSSGSDSDQRIRESYEAEYYGIMYAGNYKWDNRRCTEEAYGDARGQNRIGGQTRRSLKYVSEWMDRSEAISCLRVIDTYNCFDAEHVANALAEIPGNAHFAVGREGSPVVYAWVHDRDAGAALEAFRNAGSDESQRRAELYDELRELLPDVEQRSDVILNPSRATGRAREIGEELEELPTFAPAGPDELDVYAEGSDWLPFDLEPRSGNERVKWVQDRYVSGELDDLEFENELDRALKVEERDYVLIRAWWD